MKKVVIVKALLFDKNGRLLLVRRSKTAPRRALEWDFPGGFVDDDDESYKHACLREVREETDIQVNHNRLHLAYTDSEIVTEVEETKDCSRLYFCGLVETTAVKLSLEHDDSTWVPIDKALEMITYDTQQAALRHYMSAQA